MRVIAGKAKGRKLKQPKTAKVRPTQDRVKEALFNIIGDKVERSVFLDLFAGAGAIGIEALSRGAAEATFIEQKPRTIHENLELTGLKGGQVYGTKVATALKVLNKKQKKFDIIFLDPPYQTQEAMGTLNKISSFDILAPNGLLIVEHHQQDILTPEIGKLKMFKSRQYGQTMLSFYMRPEVI